MADQATLKDRTKDKPSIDAITTLLWTREMGQRFAVVRMQLLMDQKEMAKALGLDRGGQGTISRLELGQIAVTEKLSVSKLKEVLGVTFSFVAYGTNPERYNVNLIHKRYWDARLRVRRKNKGMYSKSRLI